MTFFARRLLKEERPLKRLKWSGSEIWPWRMRRSEARISSLTLVSVGTKDIFLHMRFCSAIFLFLGQLLSGVHAVNEHHRFSYALGRTWVYSILVNVIRLALAIAETLHMG